MKNQKSATSKALFKIGDLIEVSIERLSYKFGKGVCRFNDFVFFVGFTAPGDRVKARITLIKKNYGEAELVEVITPSIHRRQPVCPVAKECGGCQLQQVTYEEQLRQKQAIIEHQFKKYENVQIKNIVESSEYNYRNRIQLHFENGKIGFLQNKSHSIIPIKECFIADTRINRAISLIDKNNTNLERAEISIGQDDQVQVTKGKAQRSKALFAQINNEINHKLKVAVNSLLKNEAFDQIYDLYCGQGNFTNSIAKVIAKTDIIGVELSQNNVAIAQANNKLRNVKYIQSDVSTFLSDTKVTSKNTLVLLDPPRAGCGQSVIEKLLKVSPRKIIYISCDLATLSRDLELLNKKYHLNSIQGFDMFPQTGHIEILAVLAKIING